VLPVNGLGGSVWYLRLCHVDLKYDTDALFRISTFEVETKPEEPNEANVVELQVQAVQTVRKHASILARKITLILEKRSRDGVFIEQEIKAKVVIESSAGASNRKGKGVVKEGQPASKALDPKPLRVSICRSLAYG
jgi:hypothetical protein